MTLFERILYFITGAIPQPKPEYLTNMSASRIADIQRRIGAKPDGFWGPKSIAACKAHLLALMPVDNPWPTTDQSSLTKFYGRSGDETQLANLDVSDIDVRYEGNRVQTVRCHRKVAPSLKRVLAALSETHPNILRDYNGCFNHRAMRGGSLPSLHARGAAIDFCAATNGNLTAWPVSANMPLEVMEAFAREGWVAAGAFWSRDAMHFQATR